MSREQKYKHRTVGSVVVEGFLFDYTSLQSLSAGNPVAGKESSHKLSLEYKQLKKLTFSAVVFPQKTSEFRQFLVTSAWFV